MPFDHTHPSYRVVLSRYDNHNMESLLNNTLNSSFMESTTKEHTDRPVERIRFATPQAERKYIRILRLLQQNEKKSGRPRSLMKIPSSLLRTDDKFEDLNSSKKRKCSSEDSEEPSKRSRTAGRKMFEDPFISGLGPIPPKNSDIFANTNFVLCYASDSAQCVSRSHECKGEVAGNEGDDDCKDENGENERDDDCKAEGGENERDDECKTENGENEGDDDCKDENVENERDNDCEAEDGENERDDKCRAKDGDIEENEESKGNDNGWRDQPFYSEDRLIVQINTGGGKVYQSLNLVPKNEHDRTKLITNAPSLHPQRMLSLRNGIPAYSHRWIITCCQQNKPLDPLPYKIPAVNKAKSGCATCRENW